VIEERVIDGVPTLIAPSTGPTQGGIAFRVGRADESLSRAGVTHLVEHLALHHLGPADYHYNGSTGVTMTKFHSAGSPNDVGAFLSGVCAALGNLPLDRMEMEKEILRTEESGRGSSPTEPMALWRHGARGYGLLGYPEWGLSMLDGDAVRAWAQRYFTKGNAVAWIAGDVPENLTFALPEGERRPLPAITSALPQTPAYFVNSARAVALDAVVRRGPASQVLAHVLERELFRSLRQEGGLSYTVVADYEPRDLTHAHLIALADALPEKQGAVLGGFIDVLAKLRVGRIDPADIAAVVEQARESLRHPDIHAARLPGYAFNVLIGYRSETVAEILDGLAAVTVEDVRRAAEEAVDSGLLMVPEGHSADWAGFVDAPARSTTAVVGTAYPMRNQRLNDLVIGPEGVSVVDAEGPAATVRYDECAAMLMWPDGGRMLIGEDSIVCRVEPTVYDMPPSAVAQIDAAVPADRHVRQPARDPDSIPGPPPRPGAERAQAGARSGLESAGLVLLLILSTGAVCFSGFMTLGVGISDEPIEDGWAVVAFFWFVAILLVIPTVLLYRRRTRTARA